MNKMTPVKKLCICAICIALCCILPTAFHAVGLGTAFSPMHIPALLCGLLLGPIYGAVCGVVGPILASVLTGMPPLTRLMYMAPELCVYGLVAGLMMNLVHTRKSVADIYIALATAMVVGRIIGGIAQWLVVTVIGGGQVFTVSLWVTSYLVSTLPGIIAHLVVLPALVLILEKAKLIPARYMAAAKE